VTTLAGSAGNKGGNDGPGSAARFANPKGVAVDGSGNVYVADYGNATIRKIRPDGVVKDFAEVLDASAVAVDGSGNIYVTDSTTIRKITPDGVVTTLAGSAGIMGSNDGPGSEARFHWPSGVAVDGSGNVYVAERENFTIRKITQKAVVTLPTSGGVQAPAQTPPP